MTITKYRPCSIAGCSDPVRAREFCNAHWRRWKRHGDPLAGGTPKGELMRFIHRALGHTTRQCIAWPYATAGNGYGKVWFNGSYRFAHRVACELKHGPAPSSNHYAAHGCGNGHLGCVNPEHISWKTPAANSADQRVHGTVNRGARNGAAKINEGQARQIKNLAGKESRKATADRFGISLTAVGDIQKGRRWAWL